ncbi:MAG: electron transfer flavoprotein subunit alpha/FixB family protein [Bacteroidia bacterium]|nr:electron transfer flavoprotein subunit alpha/FixB family protein [Methylotenera sp.]
MTDNHNNRINPRRPFKGTASGLNRIVLTTAPRLNEAPHAKPIRNSQKNNAEQASILVISHSDRGMLDDHARQTVSAAAILANEATNITVVALILGDLRENIASCGADKVIVMPEFSFEKFQPDLELANITAVIERLNPIKILMPDNFIGDGDLGRRLIASQHTKTAATHVIEIDSLHAASPHAAGRKIAFTELPHIILLAADAADTNLPFIGSATIQPTIQSSTQVENTNNQQKSVSPYQNLGLKTIASEQVALEEADLIVSAGNGVSNVETFERLALALDAAIGASRVAVDDGKFSRDKQIGASGKTVTASTYIAIGISGAVQHLQGIKDCRHVIAINRDNSAPIVKRADLSIIGDAEAIMQALINAVAEAKSLSLQEAACACYLLLR